MPGAEDGRELLHVGVILSAPRRVCREPGLRGAATVAPRAKQRTTADSPDRGAAPPSLRCEELPHFRPMPTHDDSSDDHPPAARAAGTDFSQMVGALRARPQPRKTRRRAAGDAGATPPQQAPSVDEQL